MTIFNNTALDNEPSTAKAINITLEQGKRLSECLLWRMEREYFEKKGIDAWLHDVPFYVTSNTFIAKTYARIVIHFIRDWVAKHPEAKNHPFYVMELGTGPGQFSYYTVKALDEIRREFGMDDISIVLVMTDFAKANIDYYQQHPALKPYVEQGLLDFAIHDMAKQSPVNLIHSKVQLNQDTLKNPLTLFSNYVFDTIPNDAFAVQGGKLFELLVDLTTDQANLHNNQPVELDRINIDYQAREITGSYYNDPELDAVLELYKNTLQDTSFLVPIGSIRGLNHLRKLANNQIMLISSDKAYSKITSLDNLGYPSLTTHGGCFSMMVNCHAIGQYFVNCGGEYFSQSSRGGLQTCFYTSASRFTDMPETRVAINEYLEKFSPTDFFNVYRNMNENAQHAELSAIASYLQLSEWDPRAYMRISSRILGLLKESSMETVTFMAENMHKLADNYYHMPEADSILFETAVFFHSINNFEKALLYYQKAEKYMNKQFALKYNIALCLTHLERNQEALAYFKTSLEINPEAEEAKNWIDHLQKQALDMKFSPKGINERNRTEEEGR